MRKYKSLDQQIFTLGDYSIVPLRHEDRFKIMKWRNEQIYHLRQKEPLTQDSQDHYFQTEIKSLFNQKQPKQILFSFLQKEECIGYGGLVHINWIDKNAEISFVMNTERESSDFEHLWTNFLSLLQSVAFKELLLNKIFTYAFDFRPHLYKTLLMNGFFQEARLSQHHKLNNQFVDAVIHSKFNSLKFVEAREDDIETIYNWVNDPLVRENAIDSRVISWAEHTRWYQSILDSKDVKVFILRREENLLGQVRIERKEKGWLIDYSVSKEFRGNGYGTVLIKFLKLNFPEKNFIAIVKNSNLSSIRVFEKLEFIKKSIENGLIEFIYEG